MQVNGAYLLLSASPSDAEYFDSGAEWEALQEADGYQGDYSVEVDIITSYLVIIIFALGVVTGLVFSRIMWGRIK